MGALKFVSRVLIGVLLAGVLAFGQYFDNLQGFLLTPAPNGPEWQSTPSLTTMDAAGESLTAIGYVRLSTGPGTSKVISSAGGKVHWKSGTVTFADAGSNLRIGIQDVAATGLEDGTFDVQGDLVGGTDTIGTSAIITTAMESGTKTIAHDDLIAVSIELTARGGADSVIAARSASSAIVPYSTADSGSGPVRSTSVPMMTLEFDDGTVGWFAFDAWTWATITTSNFGSGSNPDEHSLIFRFQFPNTIIGLYARLGVVATTDDFELLLYSDPLGTPTVQRTISHDADITGGTTGAFERSITAFDIVANTDYAVAVRPTTVNTLAYSRFEFGSGNGILRKPTLLGTNWKLGTRENQTGPFATDDTILPVFGVRLARIPEAAAGGFIPALFR